MEPKYKRILLKISGDSFCKKDTRGIDVDEVSWLGDEILEAFQLGVQTAVVVGGGNFIRGADLTQKGVDSATADYMGMLATVMNALALQDVLEKKGAVTRVMTAFPISYVAEPFIRRRCIRHLEKGRIVILAAGTGNPHFTTDTAAALRAKEISADVLFKATKVDGVYDSDPAKNLNAKKHDKISYTNMLYENLKILDATAVSLCREYSIPIVVFNYKKKHNIARAVAGENIGTLVC